MDILIIQSALFSIQSILCPNRDLAHNGSVTIIASNVVLPVLGIVSDAIQLWLLTNVIRPVLLQIDGARAEYAHISIILYLGDSSSELFLSACFLLRREVLLLELIIVHGCLVQTVVIKRVGIVMESSTGIVSLSKTDICHTVNH